jgi:branched-chain amino acid transport system substrate-binding protein
MIPSRPLLIFFVTLWQVVFLLSACRPSAPPLQCTDAIGCVTIAPDEPIKIALLQALSGEVISYGLDQVRGVELAIADRGGELLGHAIELQREDDLCSKEGGLTAAQRIVTDPQIIAILGTSCSGAAVPAAKTMAEAGLVMISGSNTAPSLTAVDGKKGPNWQPGYFRTAYNDALQGEAAATFVFQNLGLTRTATLDDGDTYSQGLTDVYSQVFRELGGEIVLEATINKGDTNMRPVLEALVASGTELVFFPVFEPEGNFITLQAKEVEGFDNIVLMSADGLLTSTFVKAVGTDGVNMYFIGPNTPEGPAYDAFIANYRSIYGEAPTTSLHAHAYDAANILLDAIESVAVQDATTEGTLHIGRQALRDALYATSNFEGLTGQLACDEFGDCGVARFKVVRLDDPAAGLDGLAANVLFRYAPAQ